MKGFLRAAVSMLYLACGLAEPSIMSTTQEKERGGSRKIMNMLFWLAFAGLIVWSVIAVRFVVNYIRPGIFFIIFSSAGIVLSLLIFTVRQKLTNAEPQPLAHVLSRILFIVLLTILTADTMNRKYSTTAYKFIAMVTEKETKSAEEIFKWITVEKYQLKPLISVNETTFNRLAVNDTVAIRLCTGLFGFDYVRDIVKSGNTVLPFPE